MTKLAPFAIGFLLGVQVMIALSWRPDANGAGPHKWGGCYVWRLPVLRCEVMP